MLLEAKTALIQTGDRLAVVPDKIYGLSVKFDGFTPDIVNIPLNGLKDLQILIPEFVDRGKYQPKEAACVLADGQPVMAIITGTFSYKRWEEDPQSRGEKLITEEFPITTIANLSAEPEKVSLAISEILPLENTGGDWPGFNINKHEQELKAGQKELLIARNYRDNFTIGFLRPAQTLA